MTAEVRLVEIVSPEFSYHVFAYVNFDERGVPTEYMEIPTLFDDLTRVEKYMENLAEARAKPVVVLRMPGISTH